MTRSSPARFDTGRDVAASVVQSWLSPLETERCLDRAVPYSAERLAACRVTDDVPSLSVTLPLHPSASAMRLAVTLVATRALEASAGLSLSFESPAVLQPTRFPPLPLDALSALGCVEVRIRILTDDAVVWTGPEEIHVLGPLTATPPDSVLFALQSLADPRHCPGDQQLVALGQRAHLRDAMESVREHTERVLRGGLASLRQA